MATIKTTYEFNIGRQFVLCNKYGDEDLSEKEIEQYNSFVQSLQAQNPDCFMVWDSEEDPDNYTHCRISSLFGDCSKVTITVFNKE